jgi:hypothetical protein
VTEACFAGVRRASVQPTGMLENMALIVRTTSPWGAGSVRRRVTARARTSSALCQCLAEPRQHRTEIRVRDESGRVSIRRELNDANRTIIEATPSVCLDAVAAKTAIYVP